MSELVAYKNTNTGEVHVFDGVNDDLEARSNFERVTDTSTIPGSAIRAAQRARAERDSIEASAGIHATRVEVSADEANRAARASATGGGTGRREPVLAAARPADGTHTGEGVLAREGNTGPSRADLEDIAEHEMLHPDPRGVLSRPSLATANATGAQALAAAEANDKLAAEGLDADGGKALKVAAADGKTDGGTGGNAGDTEPGDGQGAVSGVGATDDDGDPDGDDPDGDDPDGDDPDGDEVPEPKKRATKKTAPKAAE